MEKKRLQWYGHFKRMSEDRIAKLIMEWTPPERKRGRSRKTIERVQAALATRNLKPDQWGNREMVFGFRKKATAVMKPDR